MRKTLTAALITAAAILGVAAPAAAAPGNTAHCHPIARAEKLVHAGLAAHSREWASAQSIYAATGDRAPYEHAKKQHASAQKALTAYLKASRAEACKSSRIGR